MALTGVEKNRRWMQKRFAEIDQMPKIPCACGCGTMIPPINRALKPATYAHNHHPGREKTQFKKGDTYSHWSGKKNPAAAERMRARKHTPEEGRKRIATKRARYGNSLVPPDVVARRKEKKQVRAEQKMIERANRPKMKRRHSEKTKQIISIKTSGPNNHGWKGGRGTLPYGPEFTRKFKRLIRERDNYTCQRCGKTQEQQGRTLHVHHRDRDKFNNDPTNLITICSSCHVWIGHNPDLPFELSS
jgi:hypothetical protein